MKQLLSDFLNLCFPQKEGYQFTWKELIVGIVAIIGFCFIASFMA
jgi:hypothetical protein